MQSNEHVLCQVVNRDQQQLHNWNLQTKFAYSVCNFCGATMTTEGCLHVRLSPLTGFWWKKNVSSPKNDIFRRKWSECDILVSCFQHCMSLCGTAFFDIFCIKIQGGVLAEAERKNQKSRVSKSVCGVGHATTTAGSSMRLVRLKPQCRTAWYNESLRK